ncbi:hypothetical protein JOH50_004858 [Rhizobium leguminosarum]|uniref:hypothetical protein n=1 Tax=Rhizobium leguminosarum TaxID=384 RepID=UPI001AE0E9E4|nr:hypothetical protein [Rhizobium leguminosarum]MBP2489131.1 hypothetical protein [Rhizobium leguminosarum]
MTFIESNTVEAYLRDLLAGAASARPTQLAPGLARTGGAIAGLVWRGVVVLFSDRSAVSQASIGSYPK